MKQETKKKNIIIIIPSHCDRKVFLKFLNEIKYICVCVYVEIFLKKFYRKETIIKNKESATIIAEP